MSVTLFKNKVNLSRNQKIKSQREKSQRVKNINKSRKPIGMFKQKSCHVTALVFAPAPVPAPTLAFSIASAPAPSPAPAPVPAPAPAPALLVLGCLSN